MRNHEGDHDRLGNIASQAVLYFTRWEGGLESVYLQSEYTAELKVINNSSFCSPWLGSTKRPPGTNKNSEKLNQIRSYIPV